MMVERGPLTSPTHFDFPSPQLVSILISACGSRPNLCRFEFMELLKAEL